MATLNDSPIARQTVAYLVTFQHDIDRQTAQRIFETEKAIDDACDTYGDFWYRNWSIVEKFDLVRKEDTVGWASGTDLIEKVLKDTLPLIAPKNKRLFIQNLFNAFEDADWDCMDDLANHKDPSVRKEVEKRSESE